METRFEFLRGIYFPGYMGLLTEDYDGNEGVFSFKPTEPPVARVVDYFTPRGAHIFISQGGFCLIERMIEEGRLGISVEEYRDVTMGGSLKIVELNQKYRREVSLDKDLQGKLTLTRLRPGVMPVVKIDFDIANRAIRGDLTGVIAPKPVPQTNADILRGPLGGNF